MTKPLNVRRWTWTCKFVGDGRKCKPRDPLRFLLHNEKSIVQDFWPMPPFSESPCVACGSRSRKPRLSFQDVSMQLHLEIFRAFLRLMLDVRSLSRSRCGSWSRSRRVSSRSRCSNFKSASLACYQTPPWCTKRYRVLGINSVQRGGKQVLHCQVLHFMGEDLDYELAVSNSCSSLSDSVL